MNVIKLNKNNYDQAQQDAVRVLENGGVVIAPFDTVYGFMADATNDNALRKIFELKGRSFDKPFGIILTKLEQIRSFSILSKIAIQYISDRVPGPYTFIVNLRNPKLISRYCQKNGAIGVRVPKSDFILEIAKISNLIIAQTSANISDMPSTSKLSDIIKQFASDELNQIDLVIDGGKIPNSSPSTIVDLTGNTPKEIERK